MAKPKRVGSQTSTESVVTFFLGEEECALPITEVHQIIRDIPITRIPNVNKHVEGVLNLRGVVTPIVDLKNRLGLGVRVLGDRHRLLIVDIGGRNVGFSVDALGGVFDYETNKLQPPPEEVVARVGGRYVTGVVRRGDSVVIVLSLENLLQFPKDSDAKETRSGMPAGVIPRA